MFVNIDDATQHWKLIQQKIASLNTQRPTVLKNSLRIKSNKVQSSICIGSEKIRRRPFKF
jgi:hypothetical protein